MRPTIKQPSSSQSLDRQVLLLLRQKGAQTIEGLTMLMGIGWGPVYSSVDRLSRTGKVSLTPGYPSEYRVSVERAVHYGYPAPAPLGLRSLIPIEQVCLADAPAPATGIILGIGLSIILWCLIILGMYWIRLSL
jgi:hypothetical protein